MGKLTEILGGSIGKAGSQLIDSLGGQIDQFVTTEEERKKLKRKMAETVQAHEEAMEAELTERHQADMTSDSWLSKNIRPLCLVALFILMMVFAVTDGNIAGYTIKPAYVDMFKAWGMMVFSFYFGSRGVEKVMAIREKRKKQEASKEAADAVAALSMMDQGKAPGPS